MLAARAVSASSARAAARRRAEQERIEEINHKRLNRMREVIEFKNRTAAAQGSLNGRVSVGDQPGTSSSYSSSEQLSERAASAPPLRQTILTSQKQPKPMGQEHSRPSAPIIRPKTARPRHRPGLSKKELQEPSPSSQGFSNVAIVIIIFVILGVIVIISGVVVMSIYGLQCSLEQSGRCVAGPVVTSVGAFFVLAGLVIAKFKKSKDIKEDEKPTETDTKIFSVQRSSVPRHERSVTPSAIEINSEVGFLTAPSSSRGCVTPSPRPKKSHKYQTPNNATQAESEL